MRPDLLQKLRRRLLMERIKVNIFQVTVAPLSIEKIISAFGDDLALRGWLATRVIETIPLATEAILTKGSVVAAAHTSIVVRHCEQVIN